MLANKCNLGGGVGIVISATMYDWGVKLKPSRKATTNHEECSQKERKGEKAPHPGPLHKTPSKFE